MVRKDALEWLENIDLVESFNTPTMITDLALVRKQCRLFRRHFPSTQLYYAIKCFPDVRVIKSIDPLVDGYDAASVAEIKLLVDNGVDAQRIGYSNPVKSPAAIREAVALGVSRFAYQSKGELEKLAALAPHSSVYLRVRMQDANGAISFSSKFGCELADSVGLLVAANELGLVPIGVTFHVGSQAKEEGAWQRAIEKADSIVKEARGVGLELDTINLGGGFPVQYSDEDRPIASVASEVNSAIVANGLHGIRYLAEPGRFLTANSSVIIATIIGVEHRKQGTWLFLDVGSFQAFFEIFEFGKFPYPVYSLRDLSHSRSQQKIKEYTLTGPTCDSYDTMAISVLLPDDLRVGDELMICMTGAYTIAYGSNFNGFEVPTNVFIDSAAGKKGKK